MPTQPAAGRRFRDALETEQPLQIVGAVTAYCAMMAEQAGFKAIYLSGAGVANSSYGLPDLGMTTPNDVATDIRRITTASSLPLLVDGDTGFGNAFSIARMIETFVSAGAAAVHLEDQQAAKRCGHRPNKALVDSSEMADRVFSAARARDEHDPDFVIMARTDALASEGMQATLARCQAYVEAGADMIFAEAVNEPDQYREFTSALDVPVLANMTEFGQSPLLSINELGELGIAMVLYPLSAFRAMSQAAERVYESIRQQGTQKQVVEIMQNRERLYEVLGYHEYEQLMDELIQNSK